MNHTSGNDKVDENTSDGFHTFKELYEYRMLYNAGFFNELAKNDDNRVHKSYRHSDGELCFGGGWFVVSAQLPTGQITNHYENKDWDLFKCDIEERAVEWDGHTPQDVAKRLRAYLIDMEQYAPLVNTDAANPQYNRPTGDNQEGKE